jgi:hypothetical protein
VYYVLLQVVTNSVNPDSMGRQLVMLAWLWAAAVGLQLCQADQRRQLTYSLNLPGRFLTSIPAVSSINPADVRINGRLTSDEACSPLPTCRYIRNAVVLLNGVGATSYFGNAETDTQGKFTIVATSDTVGRTVYTFTVYLPDANGNVPDPEGGAPALDQTFDTVTVDWVNINMEPASWDATVSSSALFSVSEGQEFCVLSLAWWRD